MSRRIICTRGVSSHSAEFALAVLEIALAVKGEEKTPMSLKFPPFPENSAAWKKSPALQIPFAQNPFSLSPRLSIRTGLLWPFGERKKTLLILLLSEDRTAWENFWRWSNPCVCARVRAQFCALMSPHSVFVMPIQPAKGRQSCSQIYGLGMRRCGTNPKPFSLL